MSEINSKETTIPAGKNDDFFTTQMQEEGKKIRDILKANALMPKVKDHGDFTSNKVTKNTSLLILTFNNKKVSEEVGKILSSQYGYKLTIKDNLVTVDMKNSKKTNVVANKPVVVLNNIGVSPKPSVSVDNSQEKPKISATEELNHFNKMRDEHLQNETEQLQLLRDRAKRVTGLVVHEFNLQNIKSDPANGYRSSKIMTHEAKGFRLGFSTNTKAAEVKRFLESKNYLVTLDHNNKEVFVNLVKTPAEVKEIKHEETSALTQQQQVVSELKETVDKLRTAHLTPEQIGNRIYDFLSSNSIILVDGLKKFNMQDIVDGTPIPKWEKDVFVLLVKEALQ